MPPSRYPKLSLEYWNVVQTMTEPYPFTYLSFTCNQPLADVRRDHPALMAIVDKTGESERGCGFLIHICDVAEWWKQADELLEFLTEHYLSLYLLIDPTSRATASMYLGSKEQLFTIQPQLMAICASLRIEIVVFRVDSYPTSSNEETQNRTE